MAQSDPVRVRRRRRDVAVVLSPGEFRRLSEAAAKRLRPEIEGLHGKSAKRWARVYKALAEIALCQIREFGLVPERGYAPPSQIFFSCYFNSLPAPTSLFHPHPSDLPHNPAIALTGTLCAPGTREGDGAGWVALTVARLGDEPPHPGPRVDAPRRQKAAGGRLRSLPSVGLRSCRRPQRSRLYAHPGQDTGRAAARSHCYLDQRPSGRPSSHHLVGAL